MEGLGATEVLFSELENEFTIGSEYYQREFVRIVDTINTSPYSKKPLKDCTLLITDGDHGSTQYKEEGILYLLSESIKEGYVDLNGNGTRYISQDLHLDLKRSALRPRDVVVTKTGVYFGKSTVIPNEVEEANTSAHVAKIVVDQEKLNPYFLSTFLNSKYGYLQLRRRGIKASRPEIKLIEFQDIRIALPNFTFQNKIEEIILSGQELLQASKQAYNEAEELLLKITGLDNIEYSSSAVNIKNFKDSFMEVERIDAEFYQKKYEDFERTIREYKEGYTYIGEEFVLVKKASRKTEDYFNYVEISDVNVGDGTATFNKIEKEDLPANAKILAEKDDILISKVRPNRGAVAIIDFSTDNLIVSGAFTVLRSQVQTIV